MKLVLDLACPIRELFSPPPDSQGQTSSVRFQDWGLCLQYNKFKYIICLATSRWLYWTDVGRLRIERASMDGTSRMVLHDAVVATGLTIDYASQTLYWINAITPPEIESSGVDGSNRRTVTTVDVIHPWGIVYYDRNLYWTDTTNGSETIYTASAGSSPSPRNLLDFTFINSPFGIQVVSSARQPQGKCYTQNHGQIWPTCIIHICTCQHLHEIMRFSVWLCCHSFKWHNPPLIMNSSTVHF